MMTATELSNRTNESMKSLSLGSWMDKTNTNSTVDIETAKANTENFLTWFDEAIAGNVTPKAAEVIEPKPVLVARSTRMSNAIERAKEVRPMVKLISSSATEYSYSVTSSKGSDSYTVKLTKGADNKCYSTCTCKAGQFGNTCFHVASAAAMQIAIVSMRERA